MNASISFSDTFSRGQYPGMGICEGKSYAETLVDQPCILGYSPSIMDAQRQAPKTGTKFQMDRPFERQRRGECRSNLVPSGPQRTTAGKPAQQTVQPGKTSTGALRNCHLSIYKSDDTLTVQTHGLSALEFLRFSFHLRIQHLALYSKHPFDASITHHFATREPVVTLRQTIKGGILTLPTVLRE
ncbi:hypothetical protein K491DRAFT_483726 [Lophiostoma macrostomum CBS 122681]|uniref:Uncharacterized protein n=1 Tax=Lophiostoma macrostomum CBS 122681 TaxID=1314788 RepID=A0A6A6TMF5_9PLEO|nr:hypothetical protein K491DRAFT_483726 [Lophiostoma macrostomum CBS 122681]